MPLVEIPLISYSGRTLDDTLSHRNAIGEYIGALRYCQGNIHPLAGSGTSRVFRAKWQIFAPLLSAQ